MRLSGVPTDPDPDREAVFQAGMARIRAAWTPEQATALGERLARYKTNRQRAEAEYYGERHQGGGR